MFKNYLKIALRNVRRHKAFSVINIAGLAIGIASCLLLFTVVRYELSYDTFQPNYKQIYRVVTQVKFEDGITYNPGIPVPALNALRLDFPQIITGSMFSSFGSQVTVNGADATNDQTDKKFIEEIGFSFCDPQFFQVFHYDWMVGSPTVLNEPNNTILTQKLGNKYFGDWRKAMGKYLKLDNKILVKVAGILKDPPLNSDFPLGIVTSYKTLQANAEAYTYLDSWKSTSSDFQAFVLLPKNVLADNINQQLLTFNNKYNPTHPKSGRLTSIFLQPLSDIHFDKRFSNNGDHITSKTTLLTLSLIGLFIILMACINFINLSTAQAVGRSKEIGIRKLLGGFRSQLFGQVIGETAFIVIASVILALGIALLVLPFISNVALIHEPLNLFNWQTISFLFILIITISLLAGTYPAFILSGFKPALALKNKIT
ncbi:MAG: ABC transporter permease, partial [Ginsengibacter sp.]